MRHYLKYPQALDSLNGIAEWMLLEELVQQSVRDSEEAVTWLVEQGFLERIETGSAPILYRLNPANRMSAERFVREASSENHDETRDT